MFDYIIVGSGPAGTAAALALKNKNVLVLDIGTVPSSNNLDGNLFQIKQDRADLFKEFIGENFESLHNVFKHYLSPKLKGPLFKYVNQDSEKLFPSDSSNFESLLSTAKGGLANAWGAGLMRFTDKELDQFPIKYRDLKHYYDELSTHIGISGDHDDLVDFIGSDENLQEPVILPKVATNLLSRYYNRRQTLHKKGFYLGRNRVGVLTKSLNGRRACEYTNLEFFKPYIESVYNPAFTINDLIKTNQIQYQSGVLVQYFTESGNEVRLHGVDIKNSSCIEFKCKKLILAASALNTTRIALQSLNCFNHPLQFQENAISYIPYLNIYELGSQIEPHSYPVGYLLSFYKSQLFKDPIISSIYGISGPLNSDLIFDFPLPYGKSIQIMKLIKAALFIQQVFYPGDKRKENTLWLSPSGKLQFQFKQPVRGTLENEFIKMLRPLGLLSAPFLCKYPNAGNSFHYACSLPMKENPGPFETYTNGKLFGTQNVYIADASNFTSLPSKNYSFTIMANSMRIANLLRNQ